MDFGIHSDFLKTALKYDLSWWLQFWVRFEFCIWEWMPHLSYLSLGPGEENFTLDSALCRLSSTRIYNDHRGVIQICLQKVPEYAIPKYATWTWGLFCTEGNWESVGTRKALCQPPVLPKSRTKFVKVAPLPSLPGRTGVNYWRQV